MGCMRHYAAVNAQNRIYLHSFYTGCALGFDRWKGEVMKTCELEGAELDYWVANALNEGNGGNRDQFMWAHGVGWLRYSEEWGLGGPIIEREQESIDDKGAGGLWRSQGAWKSQLKRDGWVCDGPTPLIAAMRCYVASKFGEEVSHPKEGA